ncbi:MAG: tetratricopeptide repeat protein [Candidatus Hodarchaeota archaeon]
MSIQEILNKARSEPDLRIRSEILTYALRDDPNREGAELLLRDLGETHRQLGDLDAALFYLEQAWDKDPSSPDILISLGAVYSAQKEFDQALQLYSQAYEAEGRPHILVLMADTLQNLGRQKEAEVYVRTAIRLQDDKDAPYAQYVLGKVLCGLEKYEEALNAFENAAVAKNLKTVPQWIKFVKERLKAQIENS